MLDNLIGVSWAIRLHKLILIIRSNPWTTGKPAFDVNRPKNERNLVEWIKSSVSGDETKLAQIMDPNLIGTSGCIKSAMRVLTLSSKCIEEDPKKCPSMSQVLKENAPIVEE